MDKQPSRRYLYVEDEPDLIEDAQDDLRPYGAEVVGVGTGEEALELLQGVTAKSGGKSQNNWDALFLDLNLEKGGGALQGEDVLQELAQMEEKLQVPVLVLTSHDSYAKMLSLEKEFGAASVGGQQVLYDYLIKGYIGRANRLSSKHYGALLALAAERAVALFALNRERNLCKGKGGKHRKRSNIQVQVPPAFIGVSPPIVKAYQKLRAFARLCTSTEAPSVLITGESGTGKEVAARLLHHLSSRATLPFVAINCACFPESLLESELFGYVEGSFTGARGNKEGLIRQADGGAVFLDEIGEMPLVLQAKLLRVLEQQSVRPVGGEEEIPVNVRFLAATNRHLMMQVRAGAFREDLYYRIASLTLHMPSLRARKEDIAPLFRTFVRQKLPLLPELKDVTPADEVEAFLESHPFPGNVRELSKVVERALAAALMRSDSLEPVITLEDIKQALEQDNIQKEDKLSALALHAEEALLAFTDLLFQGHVSAGQSKKPKEFVHEWPDLSLEYQVLMAAQRWKKTQGESYHKPTLEEANRWFGWNNMESYRKRVAFFENKRNSF